MDQRIVIAFAIVIIVICFMFMANAEHLDCNSAAIMSATKKYFDNNSSYASIYVMDPISGVQSAPDSCDIKYQYFPAPGSSRKPAIASANEFDYRRFSYDPAGNVVDMGDWKSGNLNI